MKVSEGYLSKEAGKLAGGVPQRTLQSWTEKGLIVPEIKGTTGTGNRRRYSLKNVIEITAYKNFLNNQKRARKEYEQKMRLKRFKS